MEAQKEQWERNARKLDVKGYISRGAFGSVFKGVYDGERVAVKLLEWGDECRMTRNNVEKVRRAFLREVSMWQKLDHPNIVKLKGVAIGASKRLFEDKISDSRMPTKTACLIMEYARCGNLSNYLRRHRERKLSFEVVVAFALDLARGLSYMHSKKIVHRDVKPGNVLLGKNHILKIADFGLSKMETSNPYAMSGRVGTRYYKAPEVICCKPYNRKCDVYSFGICLWEIYCCEAPYRDIDMDERDVSSAVVSKNLRPKIPNRCPKPLAKLMKSCWDANPKKRPEMAEVVAILEGIDTSKGAPVISLPQKPKREPRFCLF